VRQREKRGVDGLARDHGDFNPSRTAGASLSRAGPAMSASAERRNERSGRATRRRVAETRCSVVAIGRPKAFVIRRKWAETLTVPRKPNSCTAA